VPEILVAPGASKVYDPTNLHSEGQERAKLLADLLAQYGVPLTRAHLLDLGCGYGGLSLYASSQGARVTAVDSSEHKVETLKDRIASGRRPGDGQITVLHAGATDLPLPTASVDQAFTLGVIEWVPLVTPGPDPRAIQVKAMTEIARVIKPGGTYILGTKNRWFPAYTFREAQMRRPLINTLPRPIARGLSRVVFGRDYRTFIHSATGWKEMLLEAGFHTVETFLPVYFYQFPLDLWKLGERRHDLSDSLREARRRVSPDYYRLAVSGHSTAKRRLLSMVLRARLEQFLWPAFIFAAQR
jgi:SAM-dependent methyltransferase